MADVTEYLQEELAKAQRQFKTAVIVMSLVTVFVIGYFAWLKTQVDEILQPATLAEFIINEARGNMPAAADAIKTNIRDGAPQVVKFVMAQVVDGVFPMVRKAFETNLREYSADVANMGTDGVVLAFEELIRDYKAELDPKDLAEAHTDTIAIKMSGYVQEALARKLDEQKEETLQKKLDESAKTLHRINEQLSAMAKERNPDRETQLGRKLITTWWTFLDRQKAELPGGAYVHQEPYEHPDEGKKKKK